MSKIHPIFEAAMAPFLKPVETRNGPVCDKCNKPIPVDSKHAVEDEYGEFVCQSCRDNSDEAAYDRQQEKNFTDYWEGK
jgi:formylmethanofuran dehydrogenase subunit E